MNAPLPYLLLGLILGWLTFALGGRMLDILQRIRRQHRYGNPIDHEEIMLHYGRRMAGALEEQALGRLLAEEIPSHFHVDRSVVLLPEGHQLIDPFGSGTSLPVSHAAVRWVTSSGEALPAEQERLREIIRQASADVHWTGVWVPLMRGTALRGMWLLGKRAGGLLYSSEDLQCLTSLSRQAAVILESLHFARQEQEAAAEIRTLYHRVVAAQEVERGRLARDLHDGVLQDLCAIRRDLKVLEGETPRDERAFAGLADRSGNSVHTLRAICSDLRSPLLQQGLAAALEALVAQSDAGSRSSISLELSTGAVRLPEETAVAVYRIAQEALRNALQHADASEIEIRLTEYPDRLRLTVTDDGKGVPGGADSGRFVAQGHFGLAGMRERAVMIGGRLDVQTAPDYGTVVVLELPR